MDPLTTEIFLSKVTPQETLVDYARSGPSKYERDDRSYGGKAWTGALQSPDTGPAELRHREEEQRVAFIVFSLVSDLRMIFEAEEPQQPPGPTLSFHRWGNSNPEDARDLPKTWVWGRARSGEQVPGISPRASWVWS